MIRGAIPLLNVALRTGTLGTRFALVFILAKYLDAAMLGHYGLFTASIGYALLGFGLDFYIYTTREITQRKQGQRGRLLKSHAALVGILYLLLAPVTLLVLWWAGLPTGLVWWFLPILVLEHLNQEIFRLLVILSRQIEASVLLFVKQGSWAIAVAAAMVFHEDSRNLTFVMLLWFAAGLVAAVAGLWILYRMRLGGWREAIDWAWLRKGVGVSAAFLMATLSVRGIQTVDRFWLQDLAGTEFLGAYVLFFGVTSALSVFLDAAIFSFRYPELVNLAHEKKFDQLHRRTGQMALATLGACLLFAITSSLALPVLLGWIGREIYVSQIALYYWVLAAMIVYSLAMVPHYALYALGRDRPIIISHKVALASFVIATLASIGVSRPYAVPIGVLVAMSVVLVWKSAAYLKILYHDARQRQPNLL